MIRLLSVKQNYKLSTSKMMKKCLYAFDILIVNFWFESLRMTSLCSFQTSVCTMANNTAKDKSGMMVATTSALVMMPMVESTDVLTGVYLYLILKLYTRGVHVFTRLGASEGSPKFSIPVSQILTRSCKHPIC